MMSLVADDAHMVFQTVECRPTPTMKVMEVPQNELQAD